MSFEAVLALTPDLVVGARSSGRALGEKFTRVGIATYFPSTESMTEIDAMILELATRVGRRAEGTQVLERFTARRTAISRAVAHEPRVRALLVFGTTPIVVAGPGSFPDELLKLANAENVVTTGSGYPMLDVERLLALNPDVILDAAMTGTPGVVERIDRDDPGFRELAAVREGRVRSLADEAILRPGPRVAEGLATLAHALHPAVVLP